MYLGLERILPLVGFELTTLTCENDQAGALNAVDIENTI